MDGNSLGIVQLTLVLGTLYIFVDLVRFSLKSLRPRNYPPGPPALPFIGNLHQFGSAKPALKFTELQKKYGDILGLKAGSGNLVVINSAKLFRDLFDRRWSAYSGRPNDYIPKNYILKGAQHIIFLPYDGYLRQWRTAVRYLLSHEGCVNTQPIQEAAANYLAHSLIEEPTKFQEHLRTWSLVTPLVAICGYRSPHKAPHIIKWFFDNQRDWLDLLTPGVAPPVDIFPILKYIPEFLAGWKRRARNLHQNQKGFYTMMLESAKRELEHNTNMWQSLMAKLIQEQAESKICFDDNQLMYLGGGLLDAAVDTTYSSVLTVVKVFAAQPDVFKRVQDEIDAVCGTQDSPTLQHLPKLHFLRACFLEVLRWRPPTPTTLPHLMDEDDTVNGYFIPKGTVVLGNAWAVQHDPEAYESPELFNPDRFLHNPYGTKDTLDEIQMDGRKQLYCFGSGRRQCPGDTFAQASVMVNVANLAWAFDIVARESIDLSVDTGFHGGLVVGPEPFEVYFQPRNDNYKEKVLANFEKSKSTLER